MSRVECTTKEWQDLDAKHHLHPFTDPSYFDGKKLKVITKADGVFIWDSEGNKILDGMAGLWCVNIGYGRQELMDAADRQMRQLPFYNVFFQTGTPPQIELSKALAEITPENLDHIFFTNSGSEANDTVVRLARHYWEVKGQPKKKVFIGRTLGYHGSTLAGTSLGGIQAMHNMGGSLLPGFEHIMHPHHYFFGEGLSAEEFGLKAAQALEEKILEIGAENVAAFIGEPVQGSGGVIEPPSTYWPEIQRICRKHDILLVADEVICGFGRLGHWFGCEKYEIKPDIISMAKGLSSGYQPIAAVAYSTEIHNTIRSGGMFAHGYTYSGHPVACAVALANIQAMKDDNLIERVRNDTAPYFRAAFESLCDHPLVGEVRGEGVLAGVQLMKNKEDHTQFPVDVPVGVICREHCTAHNLIMRPLGIGYSSMVASPPLVINHSEIDQMVDRLRICLDLTAKDVGVL